MKTQKIESRNYGIDLLRVVSMLSIILLHLLNHGGILDRTYVGGVRSSIIWFIEIAILCAVNCYAITSGYVSYGHKFKVSRTIKLWLQILFFSFGITLLFSLAGWNHKESINIFQSLFPISNYVYWYASAFFALTFFMPVLNLAAQQIDRKTAKIVFSGLLIFGIILPSFFAADPFRLLNGCSFAWIAIMWLVGALIKKFDLFSKVKIPIFFLLYIISIVLSYVLRLLILQFSQERISAWTHVVSYSFPLIFIASIAVFMIFVKLNIRNRTLIKFIKIFAPATFGVYLIHDHPMVRNNLLFGAMSPLFDMSAKTLFITLLILPLVIFFGCSLIELIRIKLFSILGVNRLIQRFDR